MGAPWADYSAGSRLLLLYEHYEDHVDLYARKFGQGTKPPQVPEWYWRDVALCGTAPRRPLDDLTLVM